MIKTFNTILDEKEIIALLIYNQKKDFSLIVKELTRYIMLHLKFYNFYNNNIKGLSQEYLYISFSKFFILNKENIKKMPFLV